MNNQIKTLQSGITYIHILSYYQQTANHRLIHHRLSKEQEEESQSAIETVRI